MRTSIYIRYLQYNAYVVDICCKMYKRNCVVKSCDSTDLSSDKNLSFFSIPSGCDKDWLRVIGKGDDWKPKKNSKICSEHFPPHMINKRRLQPGAVPHLQDNLFASTSIALGMIMLKSVNC